MPVLLTVFCWIGASAQTTPSSDSLIESSSPGLAIIVMDLGYHEDTSRKVFELPPQVALAWAPEGRLTRALAPIAHHRGHQLLGQIYLRESASPEFSITAAMDRNSMQQQVDRVLAAIPFVQGLLPLQTSEFSQDGSAVHRFVLSAWKHRPLTVIDPWTHNQSQLFAVTRQYQLTAARRDLFMDEPEPQKLQTAWQQALSAARSMGAALVIVPADLGVLEFVNQQLARLSDEGLRLIDLDQCATRQSENAQLGAQSSPIPAPSDQWADALE